MREVNSSTGAPTHAVASHPLVPDTPDQRRGLHGLSVSLAGCRAWRRRCRPGDDASEKPAAAAALAILMSVLTTVLLVIGPAGMNSAVTAEAAAVPASGPPAAVAALPRESGAGSRCWTCMLRHRGTKHAKDTLADVTPMHARTIV